jgi:uncharacterized protein
MTSLVFRVLHNRVASLAAPSWHILHNHRIIRKHAHKRANRELLHPPRRQIDRHRAHQPHTVHDHRLHTLDYTREALYPTYLMSQTVLITGASSGIGAELAALFAQGGFHLVLVARNAVQLHRLAETLRGEHGVTVAVYAQDLSTPQAPDDILRMLRAQHIQINILVNNAGVGLLGRFAELDDTAQTQMMHLNMVALTRLTRLLLPAMLQHAHGRILNVASTAAFQPGPMMAVYYATKAYVLSLSEALAEELRGTGVTVTALCPGPTTTNFQQTASMGSPRLFQVLRRMQANAVARAGYRGLFRGRRLVIPGIANLLLAWLVRCSPRRLVTASVQRMHAQRPT